MTFIDSALLNLTEWFCRQFQLLTGRTNVWLAVQFTNLNIIVYFIWAGVYFWSSDVAERVALGLFWSGLLYVLTQTIFVQIEATTTTPSTRRERLQESETRSGCAPAYCVFDSFLRAVLSNSHRSPDAARTHGPADILAHRLDDCCAVPAGLRSPTPVRRETERVASRISSVTTGCFRSASGRGGYSQCGHTQGSVLGRRVPK